MLVLLLLFGCEPAALSVGDSESAEDTGLEADPADSGSDTGAEEDTAVDSGLDSGWEGFLDERESALEALSVPILACVARDDNPHAVFDGCYDWHSAVHGHWALLTLSRLLEDPSYAEAAEANFNEEDLALELARIEADRLGEVPYGYSWFLLLAMERERMGETDLLPLGEAAAELLDAHIARLSPGGAVSAALADDYSNLSWAVINLWRWAEFQGDAQQSERMVDAARDLLVPLDAQCPLAEDITDTDNFFPACLMRAHALLTVLPSDEATAWLEGALPNSYAISPVTNIQYAHTAGLNFSRTWGLWSLYLETGDPTWRSAVQSHIEWQLAHPQYWAEDYLSYSHWVPQFGVYSIAQTTE